MGHIPLEMKRWFAVSFSSSQLLELLHNSLYSSHAEIVNAVLMSNWRGFVSRCQISPTGRLEIFIPASHMSEAAAIADFFFGATSVEFDNPFLEVLVTVQGVEQRSYMP